MGLSVILVVVVILVVLVLVTVAVVVVVVVVVVLEIVVVLVSLLIGGWLKLTHTQTHMQYGTLYLLSLTKKTSPQYTVYGPILTVTNKITSLHTYSM